MSSFEVTVPEPQTDPDLVAARALCAKCEVRNDRDALFCKGCGQKLSETATVPIVVRFFDYWANLLQTPLWDESNNPELLDVAIALRGRVTASTETFTLSKDEREAVLAIGAKLAVDPPYRQALRPHRLAILRARVMP